MKKKPVVHVFFDDNNHGPSGMVKMHGDGHSATLFGEREHGAQVLEIDDQGGRLVDVVQVKPFKGNCHFRFATKFWSIKIS